MQSMILVQQCHPFVSPFITLHYCIKIDKYFVKNSVTAWHPNVLVFLRSKHHYGIQTLFMGLRWLDLYVILKEELLSVCVFLSYLTADVVNITSSSWCITVDLDYRTAGDALGDSGWLFHNDCGHLCNTPMLADLCHKYMTFFAKWQSLQFNNKICISN